MTSVITPNRAVFLVDDQPDIRLLWRLSIELANHGLRVVGEAGSGNDALAALDGIAADVFVIDHMMPGMSGLELAEQLRERAPGGVLILCTAYLDDELQRRAAAVGVDHCVAKEQQADLPAIILGVG